MSCSKMLFQTRCAPRSLASLVHTHRRLPTLATSKKLEIGSINSLKSSSTLCSSSLYSIRLEVLCWFCGPEPGAGKITELKKEGTPSQFVTARQYPNCSHGTTAKSCRIEKNARIQQRNSLSLANPLSHCTHCLDCTTSRM